jgi:hypothetical protein
MLSTTNRSSLDADARTVTIALSATLSGATVALVSANSAVRVRLSVVQLNRRNQLP